MAQMLLINPRRRSARKANPVARRRRKNPLSAYARRRRRNPVAAVARRMRRRRNPIAAVARRRVMRRRNPIGMGGGMLMTAIREAFIGGAGSVAVDVIQGYINKVLPANLQAVPGKVGVGDAVKAVTTVMLGHYLSGATRGLSRKMAMGALTVQAAGIVKQFVPAGMTMGGVGYYVPGAVSQGSQRVSPINRAGMGAYTRGTPLLSAYTSGQSPLLNRVMNARTREGITIR